MLAKSLPIYRGGGGGGGGLTGIPPPVEKISAQKADMLATVNHEIHVALKSCVFSKKKDS